MKINLREEETTAYLSTYQNYLEEIQKLNKEVNDVLNEVMEQSKYDKLQNLISDIIDVYSETIIGNIEKGVFTVWKESKGSLRSCLRMYHAGELADNVCAQIEQKMNDIMQDILKIDKAEIIITERPIVSEDGLERLENICKSAQTQVLNIKTTYISLIDSKYEENEIYGTLKPLVVGVTANIQSFFEASLHRFEKLHEFVRKISLQLHNIVDENGVQGKTSTLGSAENVNLNGDVSNGLEENLDEYLFQYITKMVLGKTILFGQSKWYQDSNRKQEWQENENVRIIKRDNYLKRQISLMENKDKFDWKYVIEHKKEMSGKYGYKTEGEYLKKVRLIDCKEIQDILSVVEKARLWQGSFISGNLSGQYINRDVYTFDTLDEGATIYKLQIESNREKGNYFISQKEYNRISSLDKAKIYELLQLDGFYGREDDGKLQFGFKVNIVEYEVKNGCKVDVARGKIEANKHLSGDKNNTEEAIEQIFITDDDFDKLEDLGSHEIETTVSSHQKEVINKMVAYSKNMGNQNRRKNIDAFKEITQYIYDTINQEANDNEKAFTYELLKEISVVYIQFYEKYGELLCDKFKSPNDEREKFFEQDDEIEKLFEQDDERGKFFEQKYFKPTMKQKNVQYFDNGDWWEFVSHAHRTYRVFYTVAKMFGNVAEQCKKGKANDVNLLYAAYVLFTPIIEGHIELIDGNKYAEFSKWASEKFLDILEKSKQNKIVVDTENVNEEQELDFTGENFSEDNIQMFVDIVEKIVNQTGVETLNNLVDKHYDALVSSRSFYAGKRKAAAVKEHNIAASTSSTSSTYGRYTVTNKSIQMMQPVCEQVNSVLEPIDKFYKEKFDSLGEGFEKVNSTVHALSTFIGLWGLGVWNLSKMFSTDEKDESDKDKSIMQKIQLGGIALSSCSIPGKIIMGGAHMVKILDWAMPYMKKSKILVRLSEKVWNHTRQDIQIPYVQKLMDQYVMEHYEMEYGMLKGKSEKFVHLHNVTKTIEDKHQRRAFENAVFAAETVMPQNYIINESDPIVFREKEMGLYLNLVRSGMCSKQDIESETSNEIVDKLYNDYVTTENIKPRVEINPDKRTIE